MKKLNYVLIFIFIMFIPFMVKADGVRDFYYTDLISNHSDMFGEHAVVGEDITYVVTYECTDERDDSGEYGNKQTLYVLYNSNVLEYKTVSSWEKATIKYNVNQVKSGVLKLEMDATKNKIPFKQSVGILFTVKPTSSKSTSIELKAQYDYEKLTCEDCDSFWMGEVAEKSEKRDLEIQTIDNNDNNDNTVIKDNDNDGAVVKNASEAHQTSIFDNNKYITYISLIMNFVLLTTIIVILVKKKK